MELRRATAEDEAAQDLATWPLWGGPLEPGDFLARLQRLRAEPWSREARSAWHLRSEAGEVLASCEAFRMTSRRDGADGCAFALGSVFVGPDHRGRGLAGDLLDRLARRLEAVEPAAQALLLFSEVGPGPYERAGFHPQPAAHREFPAEPGDWTDLPVTPIADGDLPELPWRGDPFEIRASRAQLAWQATRERILLDVARCPGPPIRGARAGAGFALWAADPRQGLDLLAFHPTTPGEAEVLLAAGRRVASALGLPALHLWDAPAAPSWHLLPPRLPGRLGPAPALPMVRFLRGPEAPLATSGALRI